MTPVRGISQLSERDLAILQGLGELGFMTGRQVERRWFQGPGVSDLGARRRAQLTLRRLAEQRLVHRLARRQGGSRGGSSAYIYRLDHLGRRAVGRVGRGTYREPSERFVDHSVAVAELYSELIEVERRGTVMDLTIGVEPDIWRRFTTPNGLEILKPDLLVELTTLDGWELRWFVEIDRGTEHLPTVLAKCQLYERYWRSGHEAQIHEVFPRVAWSVPDERRARQLNQALARSHELTADLFRVATAADTAGLLTTTNQIQTRGEHV